MISPQILELRRGTIPLIVVDINQHHYPADIQNVKYNRLLLISIQHHYPADIQNVK